MFLLCCVLKGGCFFSQISKTFIVYTSMPDCKFQRPSIFQRSLKQRKKLNLIQLNMTILNGPHFFFI